MNTQTDAAYWIEKLQLKPHPEGGFYREWYRSSLPVTTDVAKSGMEGSRSACTCIYYLLQSDQFSAFHRIRSDEIWHFYEGGSMSILELDMEEGLKIHRLGRDPSENLGFQAVIKAGNWFAARLSPKSLYALVGCTVAPGFDFLDFELANANALAMQFPSHAILIRELSR